MTKTTKGNDDFMTQDEDTDEAAVGAVKPRTSRSLSTWLVINPENRKAWAVREARTEQDIVDQLTKVGEPGTYELWPLRNSAAGPTEITLKEQTTLVVEKS